MDFSCGSNYRRWVKYLGCLISLKLVHRKQIVSQFLHSYESVKYKSQLKHLFTSVIFLLFTEILQKTSLNWEIFLFLTNTEISSHVHLDFLFQAYSKIHIIDRNKWQRNVQFMAFKVPETKHPATTSDTI